MGKDALLGARGRTACKRCGEGATKKKRESGVTDSRLYRRWVQMRHRCSPSSSNHDRERYYARGIRVCDEWQDFDTFREWAEGAGWRDDGTLTIERIDVNGPYTPTNCRWASLREQQRNRTNTPYIEAFGERKGISDWVDDPRCTVDFQLLWGRLFRSPRAWSPEEAMTIPARPKAPKGQGRYSRA